MRPPDDPPAPHVVVTGGPAAPVPPPRGRARRGLLVVGAAVVLGIAAVAALARPGPPPDPSAPLWLPGCPGAHLRRVSADGALRLPAGGCRTGFVAGPRGLLPVVDPDRVRVLTDAGPAPALQALLSSPQAVGLGRDGTAYTAASTAPHTATGSAGAAYAGTGPRLAVLDAAGALRPYDLPQTGLSAGSAPPALLPVDDDLAVFYASSDSSRVFRIAPDGSTTSVAGTGRRGSGGDGGPATAAELDDPQAVALDREGRLYVTEGDGRRLRRIAVDGTISTLAGPGALVHPTELVVDAEGRVVVVDGGLVRRVDPDGTVHTLP